MPATDDLQQASSRKKSNLATAFKIAGLSAPRVRAMEVFYTFCRVADDIVDEPGMTADARHAALDAWRASIRGFFAAPGGAPPHDTLAVELKGVVEEHRVPMQPLLEILDACAMDITHAPYPDSATLHQYCHGVACAVGLASIHIFGCVSPRSSQYAEALGYALQFTNILRDAGEDYRDLGRVYLPRDEMAAFGVRPEDLAAPECPPALRRLFHLHYFRAKHYFNKARRLLPKEDFAALQAARLMGAFYERILEKIRASGFRHTATRIRLGKLEKIRALLAVRRERPPATPPPEPRRTVIAGAGIAGIAAAAQAALDGDNVILLEAADRIGGRASETPAPRQACLAEGLRVDNGHHAIFGCYDNFLHVAKILGVREKLHQPPRMDIPYLSPGASSRLSASPFLPPPLHLLAALASFGELRHRDRLAILRLALKLKFAWLWKAALPRPDETAACWLARHGQPRGAVRAIWEPFCLAALNEPLEKGSARLLCETLRRTLFGKRASDSAIYAAKEGSLGSLFLPELPLALRATGGELRLRAPVHAVDCRQNAGPAPLCVVLADGTAVPADLLILATPQAATAKILADVKNGTCTPAGAGSAAIQPGPASPKAGEMPGGHSPAFSTNPILNIHLFTRRPLIPGNLCAFLDSPVQWLFTEAPSASGTSGIFSGVPTPGTDTPATLHHHALTLSTPGEWMRLPQPEILSRVRAELARLLPQFSENDIAAAFVIKTPFATYAATPGARNAQNEFLHSWLAKTETAPTPPSETDVPNAIQGHPGIRIAGDWTFPLLPSTLESAAQTGLRAARPDSCPWRE
ncbi:MAG: squalene/phytoene synthase family protein [Puniceicoccales bacterium]|jgi:phytoene/squalene synthetase/uncharacterized protein with NAD-binding domain and iron-sulfur cluster|nr:squalene/phytoene synthase family protein [Puniceicoccales bacterium]